MKKQELIKTIERELESKHIDQNIIALYLYGSILNRKRLRNDRESILILFLSLKNSGR
jgi:hypothetical protein